MLEAGDTVSEVSAPNQNDESVTLAFDEPTVVYFYPKDFTGGCTIQVNDFEDHCPEFRELGVHVYGVSLDDVQSHADFAEEEGVTFDLLADTDGEVAAAFGVDTDEGYTDRLTFLLADGEVVATYDPELADPSGHAMEVLGDARERFGGE
ncbi:peroxiredoxin [Haloglomus irregulare]|uniref:thioredoxin-dependent peroxiredoxin n=1 Tax=Haloglomus irregulare TaxID=2234134 RepID=A0A554NBX6_9EURY|nr:peroxiredoxin [Haloglomus irregulare]TSD14872.1 peroxiredoxin [Haloglomus irregulare]